MLQGRVSLFILFGVWNLVEAGAFSPLFSVQKNIYIHGGMPNHNQQQQKSHHEYYLLRLRGGQQQEGQDIQSNDDIMTGASASSTKQAAALPAPVTAIVTSLSTLSQIYSQQLERRPILTKSYTSGVIFGLSDWLAQLIENQGVKDKPFDWTRMIASTLVGLLYFGPAAHYWYEMIFKLLPGTSLMSTLFKAFWGQVIFGPSFTCIFFATSLLQAGTFSLGNWWTKIKTDLPGAWLAGAGYWPLVDFISYSVVPIKWIPLFVNICSLIWTIYLSIVANRSSNKSQ